MMRAVVLCMMASSARPPPDQRGLDAFMPRMPSYDKVRDGSKHVLTSAMSMMGPSPSTASYTRLQPLECRAPALAGTQRKHGRAG